MEQDGVDNQRHVWFILVQYLCVCVFVFCVLLIWFWCFATAIWNRIKPHHVEEHHCMVLLRAYVTTHGVCKVLNFYNSHAFEVLWQPQGTWIISAYFGKVHDLSNVARRVLFDFVLFFSRPGNTLTLSTKGAAHMQVNRFPIMVGMWEKESADICRYRYVSSCFLYFFPPCFSKKVWLELYNWAASRHVPFIYRRLRMCRETGPSPSRCSLGAGADSAAGGWGEEPLGEHIAGEGLVSVCDGASDAVKFQQTGRAHWFECCLRHLQDRINIYQAKKRQCVVV